MTNEDGGAPATTETPIPGTPEGSSHPSPKPDKEASERDYMARVNRQAAQIVQKRLGCTLEEAERMIGEGKKAKEQESATATAKATADGVIKEFEVKLAKLQAERDEDKRLLEDEKKARLKDKRRAEDKLLEVQVQHAAKASGFRDPDYALTLYARALSTFLGDEANKGKTLDAGTYFESLKGQEAYAHFFPSGGKPAEAPKAPPVAPSTAPAESPIPGGGAPAPGPAGQAVNGGKQEKDVMEMSESEFKDHMRGKYAWSPGSI